MEIFFGAFTAEWEQRRASLLHERSLGRPAAGLIDEDDEITRRQKPEPAGMGRGGGGGRAARVRVAAIASSSAPAKSAGRPMTARLAAVARGSQPAVVKLASYGSGARLGAMTNYVSREGRVAVEDEQGNRIESREDLARLRDEWSHLFQNRAETRDMASFTVMIEGRAGVEDEDLHELVRSVLANGFGDRSYAYGVKAGEGGAVTVEGLVVLRSGSGERLSGDDKAAAMVQDRYDAGTAANVAARFAFQGYGNGVGYGSAKLRDLVDRHDGDVRDRNGLMIEDHKQAGDLVQKKWRHELHSRKSRDVMHLVMSGRAGTDKDAFNNAVRDFLAAQFPGHRYVFALHDPESDPKEEGEGGRRPHVHAHAIVTMRSEDGERIRTTPEVFRQWRTLMAEKARDQGIDMEMTDRREFASAPAYGRTQVRPVSREGRTEHVGTSEAANVRYEAKRVGRRVMARSERSIRYARKVMESWREIAMASGDRQVAAFAESLGKVIISALSDKGSGTEGSVFHADFGLRKDANTVSWRDGFNGIVEAMEVNKVMTREEFAAYEQNIWETIDGVRQSVPAEERQDFDKIVDRVSDFVDARRRQVDYYHGDRQRGNGQESEEVREARRLGVEPYYGRAESNVHRSGGDIRLDEAAIGEGAIGRISDAEEFLALSRQSGRDPTRYEMELDAAYDAAGRLAAAGNRVLREEAGRSHNLRDAMLRVEAREAIGALQNARMAVEEDKRDELDTGQAVEVRDKATARAVQLALEGNHHVRDHAVNDRDLREAIAQREHAAQQSAREGAETSGRAAAVDQEVPASSERGAHNNHFDDAVMRHGEKAVREGDEIMAELDAASATYLTANEAMSRSTWPNEREGITSDDRDAIRLEYSAALDGYEGAMTRYAKAALDGNGYLYEMSKSDENLQRALDDEIGAREVRQYGDRPSSTREDERGEQEAIARHGEAGVRNGKQLLQRIDEAASDAAQHREPETRYDHATGTYSRQESEAEHDARMAKLTEADERHSQLLDRAGKEALDGNTYLQEQGAKRLDLEFAISMESHRRENAEQGRNASDQQASRPADSAEQASRPQEASPTDPPQQHVPRQEQLRRQEHERGRDDEQER